MYIFYIVKSEIKIFMNKLLKGNEFDSFEVRKIELETISKFSIEGRINKDYLPEDEKREFCTWQELKPYIFQIVKGNKKPKNMKIIFSLSKNIIDQLSDNALAMFLNVNFEDNKITCTTGTSQKNFSLDNTVDIIWEEYINKFIKQAGIAVSNSEI